MKNSIKILYWLPRVICILAILFVSLFALDSFEKGMSIWKQILAFIIHLIPSFILTLLLITAWKWEKIGGIIFLILGLGISPLLFIKNYQMNQSITTSSLIVLAISFPFVVVGILFLIGYYRKIKKDQ